MNNIEELKQQIIELKREKNAVILAHYYTRDEVQDVSDYIGDSLQLARVAQSTDAPIILFAGVNFMGETAKVLSYDKKVLLADINAGCSLADSCPADKFAEFIAANPGNTVVSYVNTSVEVKALTDIVCTSSNAVEVVNSIPSEQGIIFGPDRNLGNYIKSLTGRENMLIWDGACHVHEQFSLEAIVELKKAHPQAKVLVHPECKKPIQIIADYVGSTAYLLGAVKSDSAKEFIVVTEPGIIYQMRKSCPNKTFIAAPPSDATCACNECNFMKLITLEKIYNSLKTESVEVKLSKEICQKAEKPIIRMLLIK